MKKLVFLMAVLSAAVVATPAFSQTRPELGVSFASDSLTVPVMINAGGLGTTFATYAALMNPTSKSFPVQVTLFDSAGTKTQRTITLAAGELKSYQNFLDTVFAYSGLGTVRFQSGVEVGGSSDNLFILTSHMECAAFELPFHDDEGYGTHNTTETGKMLEFLEENMIVRHTGDMWHWSSENFPAENISLRTAASENFVIIDATDPTHRVSDAPCT